MKEIFRRTYPDFHCYCLAPSANLGRRRMIAPNFKAICLFAEVWKVRNAWPTAVRQKFDKLGTHFEYGMLTTS